jgi:hypothetical protein
MGTKSASTATALAVASASTVVFIAVAVGLYQNEGIRLRLHRLHTQQPSLSVELVWKQQQQLVAAFTEDVFPQIAAYGATWRMALVNAARDCVQASKSGSLLLYLTLQPMAYLLYKIVTLTGSILYEYVLVRGLFSKAAMEQMKSALRTATQWQLSRTPKQIALEVAVLCGLYLMVRMRQFLQRQKFVRRVQLWSRRQRRALGQVRLGVVTVRVDCVLVCAKTTVLCYPWIDLNLLFLERMHLFTVSIAN